MYRPRKEHGVYVLPSVLLSLATRSFLTSQLIHNHIGDAVYVDVLDFDISEFTTLHLAEMLVNLYLAGEGCFASWTRIYHMTSIQMPSFLESASLRHR